MTKKPSDDIDQLDERIRALRGEEVADEGGGKRTGRMSDGMRIGIELVAGASIGGVAGYYLDNWLGTLPLFLIVFLLLGFAGGFRNLMRMSK